MSIIVIVLAISAAIFLFELAALRWGYDSRDSFRDSFRYMRR